jgi:hypothetical protein
MSGTIRNMHAIAALCAHMFRNCTCTHAQKKNIRICISLCSIQELLDILFRISRGPVFVGTCHLVLFGQKICMCNRSRHVIVNCWLDSTRAERCSGSEGKGDAAHM